MPPGAARTPRTPLATPVSPAQHALCNLQNVWSYTAKNSAVRCVSSFLTAHQHIVGHFSAMDASGSSQTPTGVSGSGPSHPPYSPALLPWKLSPNHLDQAGQLSANAILSLPPKAVPWFKIHQHQWFMDVSPTCQVADSEVKSPTSQLAE